MLFGAATREASLPPCRSISTSMSQISGGGGGVGEAGGGGGEGRGSVAESAGGQLAGVYREGEAQVSEGTGTPSLARCAPGVNNQSCRLRRRLPEPGFTHAPGGSAWLQVRNRRFY